MREILFRAFVPSEGDYYYIEKGNPCWLQLEGDKITLWEEYESWCSGSGEWTSSESIREIKDFVLEQYTGLTDKNGVKIFEGDKLNWIQFNFTVICEWDNDMAKFFLKAPYKLDSIGITRFTRNQFEIIGNIHEESK
jgi:uncharacterized phage protein (TIGR01671 family)